MTEPNYNEGKLRELVLYLSGELRDDRAGGPAKLGTVCYFIDFAHMRRYGEPITGADYRKRLSGPTPRQLRHVRESLLRETAVDVLVESFLGHEQRRLVARRPPDVDRFSPREVETIEAVLTDVRDLSAQQIRALAEAEPGWLLVDEGEQIPYVSAFIVPHMHTETSRRLALEVARRYGVAATG
jgi:hypothetical protein